MIAASPVPRQRADWQLQMTQAVSDAAELCLLLGLDPVRAGVADSSFPLRVPRSFVARMRHGDYADPLLRQVLATAEELRPVAGYDADPLQEVLARRHGGLLQKYAHRVLLITTGACAVHCRYCFRREFPYGDSPAAGARWQAALAAITADTSIEEVILSGGDPLSLGNARLEQLLQQLATIAHVQRIRIHTRQPVVLPDRVDDEFCQLLRRQSRPVVVVLHVNHANEIDDSVRSACARLRATGAVLLNQAVLLAGVNDSLPAQVALAHALWSATVLPYYLHLLDHVRGTSHFEVTESAARALYAELQAVLPGYLLPRLVRELPGATSKTLVAGR